MRLCQLVGGLLLCTFFLLIPSAGADTKLPALFDPARHMRVSEVEPGMKGYGLSVFRGTKIERFDVEVVSILRNFNPKFDVVLIRCSGANLEHTGPIAGMSGSPIFLKDAQGRERMIGAFAYGWPMVKDPIAGVQPIEYMLRLAQPADDGAKITASPNANSTEVKQTPKPQGKIRWSLSDVIPLFDRNMAKSTVPLSWLKSAKSGAVPMTSGIDESAAMRPLATPLMTSGISTKALDDLSPIFSSIGLTPLQAGGVATGESSGHEPAPLAPGSVLAAPLLTGDMDMTAIGTCTEVIGDRFVGFGHSFNNEGTISLPIGSGEINAVIARLDQSFKLGAFTKMRGTLTGDRVFGVGGDIGDSPATVPIDVRVVYADGSQDQTYHFAAALHPRFTPLLAGLAMYAAVSSSRDLPQYHTVDYSLKVDFANNKTIDIANVGVNVPPTMLYMELALPMTALSDNPFERVAVRKISGVVKVMPEAKQAEILYVNVPKLKHRPGDTVKAYVVYRPFRAAEAILPIQIELPRDLADGAYQLVVSDWQRYLNDEATSEPFRFTAESADEVFAVVRDFASIRHDAIYARLVRQPDGVAVGRAAMPRLPSSRREILLGAGRSNTTPFVSSTVKTIPTGFVMEGSAEFQITIDSEARVEVGNAPRTGPRGSDSNTGPSSGDEKGKSSKSDKPEKPEADAPSSPTEPPKP